jgi:glycosyltransferase involved in cell wall biosynthesis
MSNYPLVTVVIPNYNHELYLKERIESVLNQRFQDFELYILDDCSTDNSLQIINSYKTHAKVKGVLKNKINAGSLFKQWIKAIELAKGKYLWIAESDDFAHIDFLKETVAIAEQNREIGLVFTDSNIVDHTGKIVDRASSSNKLLSSFKQETHYKIEDRNKVLDYFISNLIIWNASAVLFHTETIKKVDFKILESLQNAGDLFTYIHIALKNDIVYLNKPLNNFRMHADNTTTKNISSGALFKDRMTIMEYFLSELQQLSNSKAHLISFISRSFLTTIDFKLYKEVQRLLKAYSKYKLLSFSIYLQLSFYVCCNKIFKKVPDRYRNHIKQVFKKIV